MKFITVCVIVCAIALNLYLNCAEIPVQKVHFNVTQFIADELEREKEQTFDPATWNSSLLQQYDALANLINATWLKCKETFSLPEYQVDMFSSTAVGTNTRKCLVDCTLRLMGVVMNDDLDPSDYIDIIHQLRNNYTSFDIYDEDCYTLDEDNPWKLEEVYPDMCHILFVTNGEYCSSMQDPHGDLCQSSWMMLSCLMRRHRQKFEKSPFSPIFADTGRMNQMDQTGRLKQMDQTGRFNQINQTGRLNQTMRHSVS
ncbi:hypothetical protein HA402_004795 [Bradysia odoriphaga]|nr:hypothetical protein HA402_004795 [Bradysia odoriphaga]